LASIIVISGCSGELSAKIGDIVKVHYTGTLANGTVFDSSYGGDPLEFTVGDGDLLSAFEQAVIGMKVGQSITVTIPAEHAYGLIEYEVNRDQISTDLELEIGQQVYYHAYNYIVCTVTAISETTVKLHNNHSLAGEDLTFEIELVEIL
jgi:FKBP-type peptidyl-prolyl cis-trans isomerase 2